MNYTHFNDTAAGLINSFSEPDTIDTALLCMFIFLCLYYLVAYMSTHAQSLRHQIHDLKPCKQARAIWTKRGPKSKYFKKFQSLEPAETNQRGPGGASNTNQPMQG